MFSPGTVKALGLISKGVDVDTARNYAAQIDSKAAEARLNFYSQQSISTMAASTLPTPSTTVSPSSSPSATVASTSSQSVTMKDVEAMIKSGEYTRNTTPLPGHSTLENSPMAPPTSNIVGPQPESLIVGSKRKRSTFFDQRFLPTPEELEDQELARITPEIPIDSGLLTTKWGKITLDRAVEEGTKNIVDTLTIDTNTDLQSVSFDARVNAEKIAQLREEKTNLNPLAKNFLLASDEASVVSSQKLLVGEIDKRIAELKENRKFVPTPDYKTMGMGAAMNVSSEAVGAYDSKIQKLEELKSVIQRTAEVKIEKDIATNTANSLKDALKNSEDREKFLKSLDSYKDVAGGLVNTTGNYVDVVKRINVGKYLDRPITEEDEKVGGEAVINTQALDRFQQKTALSWWEENDTRLNETQNHIVQGHVKLGSSMIESLTKDNRELIKKQEKLVKDSNNPNVSADRLKQIQQEFKSLSSEVELNNQLIEKIADVHGYDSLKKNKEITPFAGDYLEDQEEVMKNSREYYSKNLGGLSKFGWQVGRTVKKLASGTAQLGLGITQGVGTLTGWDSLAERSRMLTTAVTVSDLVNFDLVNNRGEYQTADKVLFTDSSGKKHWQPSALWYVGAETAPLVIATAYGASGLTSLGGRALASGKSSLIARGLMSAKRGEQFTRTLAATRNYAAAFRATTAQSGNALVRSLGSAVPQKLALGSLIYPAEFGRTYEDLYRKGIPDARAKAHLIAGVSTSIEMLTEMFPDIKYLDDFAEKGVGVSKFINRIGGKWTGNLNQYRTLYGDVFGKAFSGKTLDYLAASSANALGQTGAVLRFMGARGIEEGIEETAAELGNFFADNYLGLAAMKGEPPAELTVDNLVNAFTGALLGPPMGVRTQLKNYSENKHFGQLFDIMLNGQYYKNKVSEALKEGKITNENAAIVLSKIQELEAVEKEYGIRNLKNFQSIKAIESIADLMEDPALQYDYFKNVLKKRQIDEKLTKLETENYTDEQKQELIKQAEEAERTISDYKERSDFYSQMSDADKKDVLDKNIAKKVQLSKRSKTESLEKLEKELEDYTADTIAGKRPEYFTESVRAYRDNIAKLREERAKAEESAMASGQYNPIADHIENNTPTTSLADINDAADLEDMLVQAILAPDRGSDVLAFLTGAFDQQLEALDADTERITQAYLEQLSKTGQTDRTSQPNLDGSVEIQEGTQNPGQGPQSVEFLTEAQQNELNEMLTELTNQYDDILERKQQVAEILNSAFNAVIPREILEIQDPEAKDNAIGDYISSVYRNTYDKYLALEEMLDSDPNYSQEILYNRLRFDEYLADNTDKYNKAVEKYRTEREARMGEGNPEASRQSVSMEVTNADGSKEKLDVPELTPADVDPEFTADLEELENTPATVMTSTTSEAAGDIISQEEYNKNRSALIQRLLDKVLASPNINSAKAKLFAVMEAAGATPEDIKNTLELLDKASKNEPILEDDYTHMFNLLLIKAGSLNRLVFAQAPTQTSTLEEPPVIATDEDTRTPEQIESTTVIPNVTLRSLEGKEVVYNGVRGTLVITPGGIVTVETSNVVYELEGATPETSSLEHMIQEYKPEAEIKQEDVALSENEVVLDGIEYLLQTDAKGNVVAIRDKKKPQKRITNNKLLVRAEIARNRLEHEVLTDMAEESPEELMAAAEEAKAQFNSAVVVENAFAFNLSETVANAIEKLYEDGGSRNLSDTELLQTELWLMDTWSRLDDLAREYPDDEIIQNALENITIINQLLYNGKPAKAPRKTRSKKPAEAKEKRTAPKKKASKKPSKSPVVKETAKPTQLTIDFATGVSPEAVPPTETPTEPTLPFESAIPVEVTPESNVEDTQANVTAIVENVPEEPKPDVLPATPIIVETPQEKTDKEDNKKQTLTTNPLKMFITANNPDNPFLELQEKIIKTIDQEFFAQPNTAVVDLFTLIEETLGTQTLTKMQDIFNEVQAGVTEERKAQLRQQFISLFPTAFLRPGTVEFMFDTQIVGKVSQSNVSQVDQRRLDADEYEVYLANKGRRIPQVQTKDGRTYKNLLVRQSDGKFLLLYKEDILDADNKKVGETETWIRYDQIKNPETVLAYPIQGNAPIQFNDLNVLTFTLLDANGKVEKFDSLGNRNSAGTKALLLYLPTSKNKANPTDQQKAMDALRMSLGTGARVKQSAPLTKPSFFSGTVKDPVTEQENRIDYIFEFSTGPMIPVTKTMDKAQVEEEKAVTETIAQDQITQESTVIALEKVIALAKTIPDPSKEGYLINGKRYERQSRFVQRAFGDEKVQTEDSVLNMELGAAVGNLLDIIGRDVLGGAKVKSLKEYIKEAESMGKSLRDGKGYKLNLTEEQFNQVVSELREIAQELTGKGWKVFTEGLVVFREFTAEEKERTGLEGVAGAMDIVAVDPDGGLHIIDFKNKKFRSEEHFKSSMYLGGPGYPSNVSKWGTQQTTYGILSKDFGLPVKSINILAFASQYTSDGETITIDSLTKGTGKVPVLPQNVSPISDSIIKLKYDHNIAKQIALRTKPPVKEEVQKAADQKDLSKIKEQLGETNDIDAKNANLVLSSLNVDVDNLLDDIDPLNANPDNLNPPPCSP